MVCLSVTLVSPAKTANRDAIWVEDLSGPRDHVLDGGSDPPMGSSKFLGENGHPIVKYRDILQLSVERRLNR